MSGGTMNYLYEKIEGAYFSYDTVLRRAFRKHLKLVAECCKAIEWNDSGDGADDEEDLLRRLLKPEDELRQATEDAEAAHNNLALAIDRAVRLRKGGA